MFNSKNAFVNEKEGIITNVKPVKEWPICYEKTWPKSILYFGNFLNRDGIIEKKSAIAIKNCTFLGWKVSQSQ